MPRKKTTPPPPKIPAGVKRVPGQLICNACKFVVPYQGFTDESLEARPTHRCAGVIRGFDTFDTRPPKVAFRKW